MKTILLILTIAGLSFGLDNFTDLQSDMDSLKEKINNDGAPKGFLIGRGIFQQQQQAPAAPVLESPASLFHDAISPQPRHSGYVSIREYDKDYKIMNDKLDMLAQNQKQLAGLIGKQQESQKNSTESLIKLIEGLTALATAIGVIIGGLKIMKSKKG